MEGIRWNFNTTSVFIKQARPRFARTNKGDFNTTSVFIKRHRCTMPLQRFHISIQLLFLLNTVQALEAAGYECVFQYNFCFY